MKRVLVLLIANCCLLTAAFPQTTQTGSDYIGKRVQLTLSNAPQQVTNASVFVSGNPGPATYYYWIVTQTSLGASSPAGPFQVINAPNTLSVSNFNQISWAIFPGATYDVLRTSTPGPPFGACNCAVATAVAGNAVSDQSSALSAYTVNPLDPNTLTVILQNVNGSLSLNSEVALKSLFSTAGLSVGGWLRSCNVPLPLGDGLVQDGVTNDRVALNNCLANAFANGQNVAISSGRIHVQGGAVNDTNKPGMNITGVQANEDFSTLTVNNDYGTGITQIMCDTGTDACWDMVGSGGQEIKHIALRAKSSYATPSKVGFLMGRDNVATNGSTGGNGTYCFAANDIFNNVWVFFDSRPAASALGTVAVYDQGAETYSVIGGGYLADMGFMFGTANVLSFSSTFQTLGTGCAQSMTEIHMQHTNIGAFTGDAVRFDDQVANFTTDPSTEFINLSPGTNHNPAFSFNASTFQNNIFMWGQVENFDFPVAIAKNADRWNMNLLVGGNVGGAGLIQWAANGVSITNSNINFQITNGVAAPLINSTGCTGCTIKGSIINEGGLTGTGSGASGTTLTTSTVYADGLTDGAVNTWANTSSYKLIDSDGISTAHDGIISIDPLSYRLASTYTNSTTSLTNVPGFAISVVPNKTYHVTCQLYYQAAATGGLQVAFTAPASPTGFHVGTVIQTNTSNAQTNGVTTSPATKIPTTGVAVGTAATDFMATVEATLRNGANAGTLQLQAASVAAAQLTVETDSECLVH